MSQNVLVPPVPASVKTSCFPFPGLTAALLRVQVIESRLGTIVQGQQEAGSRGALYTPAFMEHQTAHVQEVFSAITEYVGGERFPRQILLYWVSNLSI